jgi:cyclase
MPFTVGGGIGDISDIRNLLNAGADKVSLNTQAVKSPELIVQAASKFGSQCIVVAIDARQCVGSADKGLRWEVYINGGRTPAGIDAVAWARQACSLGAGEILLTSMDYDGTKNGYDISLTKKVSEAVSIPVIASGGAGILAHFFDCFHEAGADACLAASIFHYQEYSVGQVKEYLSKRGISVRL